MMTVNDDHGNNGHHGHDDDGDIGHDGHDNDDDGSDNAVGSGAGDALLGISSTQQSLPQ